MAGHSAVNSHPHKRKPSHNVKLSKLLSFILRHGAAKEGLNISPEGYVHVSELLAHDRFKSYTVAEIELVVKQNEKQRFSLRTHKSTNELLIRANQGHSIGAVSELELEAVDPLELPQAIHGTGERAIDSIRKQGLSRMKRHHIHMAAAMPGEDGVISGMRASSTYLVHVDIKQAHADGLRFFRSENNVILCEGDENGFIEPKYLKIKKLDKH